MTRYLIGQSVASDPFLNIYEANDVGTTPPTRLGFKPGIMAPIVGLKFSQKQKELALVVNARRSEVPGIGNPATAIVGIKVFSPEDNYVLVGGDSSNIAQLYYRRGPYYIPVAAANVPLPTTAGVYVTAASLSNNGNVLSFVTSDAPTIVKLCDKTTDATTGLDHWTARSSLTQAGAAGVKVTPDSQYVITSSSGNTSAVYKLISNVYTAVSRSGANPIQDAVQRSDGNLYVIEKSATSTVAGAVYKYDGTTWTLVVTLQLTTTSMTSSSGYKFSAKGDTLIYCYIRSAATTADVIATYYWNGTTFVKVTPLTPVTSPRYPTVTKVVVSNDGAMVAVSFFSIGASPQQQTVRLYTISGGVYTLAHEWVVSNSMTVQNFSPDNSVLHLGLGTSSGQHFSTSTFLELTSLPEAPGVAASTVYSVVYGSVGQASFAFTSTLTIPAIRDGKGAYLDSRTLEGTFVSLYDRKPGVSGGADFFQERTFVQHLLGTIVSDIVFSPDSKVLLYHTQRPGVTDQSGLGRFVYDISIGTFMTYKGAIYLASDDASFAAVNASSSYFVVCFENASLGDNIRLYKLSSTFAYTDIDHHLVDFGPVAFSVCETVVVAHGGDTPYTLYSHTTTPTDALVLQPISFTDWHTGSDVLAVAFTPDCDGVVLVTPDAIIIEDTDTGVPDDEAPQTTPTDQPPTIETDPDDPTKMIVVPRQHDGSSGGGGGGGSGGPTGINVATKTVDKFEYTPYVSINITYRTW